MSLNDRDTFAVQAMAALAPTVLGPTPVEGPEYRATVKHLARVAYDVADEMLRAKKRAEQGE